MALQTEERGADGGGRKHWNALSVGLRDRKRKNLGILGFGGRLCPQRRLHWRRPLQYGSARLERHSKGHSQRLPGREAGKEPVHQNRGHHWIGISLRRQCERGFYRHAGANHRRQHHRNQRSRLRSTDYWPHFRGEVQRRSSECDSLCFDGKGGRRFGPKRRSLSAGRIGSAFPRLAGSRGGDDRGAVFGDAQYSEVCEELRGRMRVCREWKRAESAENVQRMHRTYSGQRGRVPGAGSALHGGHCQQRRSGQRNGSAFDEPPASIRRHSN